MTLDNRTPAIDAPQENDQAASVPAADDARKEALERIRRVAEKIGYQTRLDEDGRARIWSTDKAGEALVVGCEMGPAEDDPTDEELYYTLSGAGEGDTGNKSKRWLPAHGLVVDDEELGEEITHQFRMAAPAESNENGSKKKPERPDPGDLDDWDPDDLI